MSKKELVIEKEPIQVNTETETLDSAFSKFENTASEFKAEDVNTSAPADGKTATVPNPVADVFKIKMFLGFACFLLSGFNTFLLNMFMKKDVSFDDMILTDTERETLVIYLNTPDIIKMIDKLPGYVWAIAHVEYMFIQKYRAAAKLKEVKKEIENK